MDRLGCRLLGDITDPLLVQVTLGRVCLAHTERLVRVLDVERILIRVGVDRNRIDIQF